MPYVKSPIACLVTVRDISFDYKAQPWDGTVVPMKQTFFE
jgi:hypothetical protein